MADYGLVLYGNAIMVNPDYAKANPKVVAGFVRATIKGMLDTIRDPEAAIKSVMKRNDTGDETIELDRLQACRCATISSRRGCKANGFGGVDMARLAKSIDQIALTYDFKNRAEGRRTCSPASICRRRDRKLVKPMTGLVHAAALPVDRRLDVVESRPIGGGSRRRARPEGRHAQHPPRRVRRRGRPSGCGKSSLMKLVTGLRPARSQATSRSSATRCAGR